MANNFAQNVASGFMAIANATKAIKVQIFGSSTGGLGGLATTDKSSIVNAINEVKNAAAPPPPDGTSNTKGVVQFATLGQVATGTSSALAVTPAGVRQERAALKAEILGGADPAWDTLQELKAFIDSAEESGQIDALTTVVGSKANSADVYLKTEIGDVNTDFVAVITQALA